MNSYRYEPWNPRDIESLLAMRAMLYAHYPDPYNEAAARRTVEMFLDRPALGRIYSMRAQEQIVGYLVLAYCASLEFGGRFALVDELFVTQPWRGQGAGRGALDFVAERCRGEGIVAVRLEVDRDNARARELYRRAGFEIHDRDLMTKWL